jgi:hypothetical protein
MIRAISGREPCGENRKLKFISNFSAEWHFAKLLIGGATAE